MQHTRMQIETNNAAINRYKFTRKLDVLWGDMDAMNHVNNARYFRYMESARLEFLALLFPVLSASDLKETKVSMALAETRCRFKVSLSYPDEILVGCAVKEVHENHFIMQHEIYSKKLDCIAAEGDARMVYFDYENMQKVKIDDKLRSQLEAYGIG
jgi:acyl-CoA thioester hydrolase